MLGMEVSNLTLGAAGLALYCVGKWIYNVYFHPLAHVPGPWYAAMSPVWLSVMDMAFRKALVIDDLFKKYGPVVRIEPNVVAFLDPAAMKTVYSATSRFPKSVWYKALLTNEHDHAMTTLEPHLHAPRKRAYAPHYVPNNLSKFEPEMHEYARMLLGKLDEYAGDRAFDCLVLFRRLLVDVIFVSSYGQRINSLRQWDIQSFKNDDVTLIVSAINMFPIRGVLRSLFPGPVWSLLTQIPIEGWKRLVDSDQKIAQYVIRARNIILAKDAKLDIITTSDHEEEDERLCLVNRLLRQQVTAKPGERLSDEDIVSEAMAHTIAGVDTTATSLSFMFYTISKRPDVLAKLRAEIDPLMPEDGHGGERQIPDIQTLQKLPYLTGLVKETLRMFGSAPSLLERTVPDSLNGQFSIAGVPIPSGSTVATQSWSVHHCADIFPDPWEFKPERWFDETPEMTAAFMPFGTGGRICGGMNLAQFMLRIAPVAICRNFDPVAPPQTNDKTMAARFAFVLLPAAQRADIIFVPRKH